MKFYLSVFLVLVLSWACCASLSITGKEKDIISGLDFDWELHEFKKQADKGDSEAQYKLALMCFAGHGAVKDQQKALKGWPNPPGKDMPRPKVC